MQNEIIITDVADKVKKKRWDTREDGKVFWGMRGDGREIWLPVETAKKRQADSDRRNDEYRKRKLAKSVKPENPRKRGETRDDGMIFFSYSNVGSEVWVTTDEFKRRCDKQTQARKRYAKDNVEAERLRAKKWQEENPEKFKASHRASREKHREKRLQMTRDWRERNKEHLRAYYETNKDRSRKNLRRWVKARYASDPKYALISKVRRLTLYAISRFGFKKNCKTSIILGCDWETLQAHIESQFYDGMTWESFQEKNYTGTSMVEIDHIIPISSAKTEEDVIRLAHFSNLQPMWWWENREKRDKMPHSV
jgi:hypothetical protein